MTKPKPAPDATDRDVLLRVLHDQPGKKFSTVGLQMITGIPSERCFRGLKGAPGVHESTGTGSSMFWVMP